MSDENIPAPAEDTPLNGVIIVREEDGEGGVHTKIVLSGDVKPTEVETIIKLGLKGWHQQIGL